MKVKISAVTMPGMASGSVIRAERAEPAGPVDHRRLLQLDRDRREVGVEDPDRERQVEAGVDQDQREDRAGQREVE